MVIVLGLVVHGVLMVAKSMVLGRMGVNVLLLHLMDPSLCAITCFIPRIALCSTLCIVQWVSAISAVLRFAVGIQLRPSSRVILCRAVGTVSIAAGGMPASISRLPDLHHTLILVQHSRCSCSRQLVRGKDGDEGVWARDLSLNQAPCSHARQHMRARLQCPAQLQEQRHPVAVDCQANSHNAVDDSLHALHASIQGDPHKLRHRPSLMACPPHQ
mmetsp:Transcript_22316/g.61705  ORF Transcript_22316/g.61705 Transcript_22316/m.61705 type:complete len:215 (-) Transcript_22316:1102-1746(-)